MTDVLKYTILVVLLFAMAFSADANAFGFASGRIYYDVCCINEAPSVVVGGGGSGGVTYDFSCEKSSCYGCNLKCIVQIKNTDTFPKNVTANYDVYLNGKKSTITKNYQLGGGAFFAGNEYLPIYRAGDGVMAQFGFMAQQYPDAKVIANFSPYSTEKVVLFSVGSVWSVYKWWIIGGVAGIVVVVVVLKKKGYVGKAKTSLKSIYNRVPNNS